MEDGPAVEWDDLVHKKMSIERSTIGDFIFVRSTGMPAYNFAVTVDDATMGINQVVRGDDHLSNTPRQILLYQAMGFDLPRFGHLPMILGPDGSRMSKRHGATSVDQFRQRGYLPEAMINFLAFLGWNPGDEREFFTKDELVKEFSIERVNKAAAIFNFEKLDFINGKHKRSMTPEQLLPHMEYFFKEKGFMVDGYETDEAKKQWYADLISTFDSGDLLTEISEGAVMAFEFDPENDLEAEDAQAVLSEETAATVISSFLEQLKAAEPGTLAENGGFKPLTKAVQKATGIKGKNLFHPVRLAITGKTAGPELGKLVPLLEKGKELDLPLPVTGVIKRVSKTLEFIENK